MAVEKVTLSGSALLGVDAHLIPAHVAAQLPQTVCLGRIRPKTPPSAPRLRNYLRPTQMTVPPPTSTNWRQKAAASIAQTYLNNSLGTCVIAGKMHALGVWSANDLDHDPPGEVLASDDEVRQQYVDICGPDNRGCIITPVLDVMRSTGLLAGGRYYKIDGYVAVDWTNQLEVKVVQAIFGASTIGFMLPYAWEQNAIWDVTDSPIHGPHDVTAIDYDEKGVYVASWGRKYLMTWAALASRTWVDEMYALLAPLWYGNDQLAPSGIDAATLKADLDKLASGEIPSPPDDSTLPWQVQFTAQLDAGRTVRYKIAGWSKNPLARWRVVPKGEQEANPQLSVEVDPIDVGDTITYVLTITNSSSSTIEYEAQYYLPASVGQSGAAGSRS